MKFALILTITLAVTALAAAQTNLPAPVAAAVVVKRITYQRWEPTIPVALPDGSTDQYFELCVVKAYFDRQDGTWSTNEARTGRICVVHLARHPPPIFKPN